MTGWKVTAVLSVFLLVSTLSALAQQTPTPTTVSTTQTGDVDVVVGAYQVSVPSNEPVVLVPLAVENNVNGKFITYVIVAQGPNGTFVPLTRCDDLAVLCGPLTSPAKSGLRVADPGDAFIVTEQGP